MDTNSIFMLGFYVWWLCGVTLLVWRLWSRKGWVLSTNKILFGLLLGFAVPMLFLATAMGMSMDAISNSLSSETRMTFFAWVCPGITALAFVFSFFIMWLALRKYALIVHNASADDVADCIAQALRKQKLEYGEEYPRFVVSDTDVVITLVDSFSWVGIEVANKAQFPTWKALEQDIAHGMKDKRALRRSFLVYPLLMYLPQFLVLPLTMFFPSFKITFFDENRTYISSFFETLVRKGLFFPPLLILFSVFFLALGLRLVFGKPLAFRFNTTLPFFTLIIILAQIVMAVEYGIGWPTIGLFLSDIGLLLWIADLPSIVIASNTTQPVILEAFQTAFQRNNVHFSQRRSMLYLPRLNRIITAHPNKGNPDWINLIIEGRGNKLEFNNLLNDALSELKKRRIRRFNARGIIYIVIGLLPALYFLFK